MLQPPEQRGYDVVYARTREVWEVLDIKVITIMLPMILMLRSSLQFHLFSVIMMLRGILIGR